MQCEQFERILEREEDGGLPQAALAHLEGCDACRAMAADFTTIHDLAMELGAEGIATPERVWISLRNQLEAEGIIREPQGASPRPAPSWWVALQGPAFAGALLSLILAGAVTVIYRWGSPQPATPPQLALAETPSSVPTADSIFKEEVLTVGGEELSGLPLQNATVTDSFRRNLQIVDNFIAMCEKSVREQPDNQMAREYLYGAYQQKAELLATAMNRSMPGGVQ